MLPTGRPVTPTDPTKEPRKPEEPKQRDPFFDNAKYLAIVLVAAAHSWEPLIGGSRTVKAAYLVVYAFHMPAFIIISGYFSRSFTGRPAQIRRLLTGVVLPYVVFETAYSLLQRWAGHDGHAISLIDPYYLTWFLIALFIWRLTSPIWKLVRQPLPVALVIAALATVSPQITGDLDMQRVLQFLPYFVVGLLMRPEHFDLVRQRGARLVAVPVFVIALVLAYVVAPRVQSAWLYHDDAAVRLGASWWTGPIMTLALFACSMTLTACFYALVPRRTMWFTTLGAATLYGYLMHGFVLQAGVYTNIFSTERWLHSPGGEVLVTLVACGAVTLFCTKPFRKALHFVMEPEMAWAFRKPGPAVAGPAE
jgi:fucose 4-O-acetylase-like acetyltransferase